MPVFDVFQSSFKPRLKFFAGVYFAYRIVLFGAVTFSRSEFQFHASTELIFLAFLGIHAVFQPYKCRLNNMVDGLLFLNLAVINGLNIVVRHNAPVLVVSGQCLLVTAPIFLIIIYHLFTLIRQKLPYAASRRARQSGRSNYESMEPRSLLQEDSEEEGRSDDEIPKHSCSIQEEIMDTY